MSVRSAPSSNCEEDTAKAPVVTLWETADARFSFVFSEKNNKLRLWLTRNWSLAHRSGEKETANPGKSWSSGYFNLPLAVCRRLKSSSLFLANETRELTRKLPPTRRRNAREKVACTRGGNFRAPSRVSFALFHSESSVCRNRDANTGPRNTLADLQ